MLPTTGTSDIFTNARGVGMTLTSNKPRGFSRPDSPVQEPRNPRRTYSSTAVCLHSGMRTIKLKRGSLACYYIAYAAFVWACFLSYTSLGSLPGFPLEAIEDALYVTSAVLLAIKFLAQEISATDRFRAPALMAGVTIVIIGLIPLIKTGAGYLLWIALFIACSKNVRLHYVAIISLAASALIIFIAISSTQLGLVVNNVTSRGDKIRYYLGFGHPNMAGFLLFLFCTSIAIASFGTPPAIPITLLILTSVINYQLLDSRTAIVASLLEVIVLLLAYFVHPGKIKQILFAAMVGIVFFLVALSFYLMVTYDPSNPLHAAVDQLFSTRLSLAHRYYSLEQPSLFGNSYKNSEPLFWLGDVPITFLVDSAYCALILQYGIIPTTLLLVGVFALMIRLVRAENYGAILMGLLLMGFYALTETVAIRIDCNYFFIAIGTHLLFAEDSPLMGRHPVRPSLFTRPNAAVLRGAHFRI